MSEYTVKTFAESGSNDEDWRIIDEGWREFMLHDPVGDVYFDRLYDDFPDFQYALYEGDTVIAACNSIPVLWDMDAATLSDEGWDWALVNGYEARERKRSPTTLCALSITIARSHVGKGFSKDAVLAMKAIAVRHGFNALIAPVRPSMKEQYPLTPMERYIRWTNEHGAPFDPWMRTHWRVGGKIVRVAPRSMIIPGTVAEWTTWTGMKFPESGEYVVPGALNPVTADIENDRITYVEPNVWTHHPID